MGRSRFSGGRDTRSCAAARKMDPGPWRCGIRCRSHGHASGRRVPIRGSCTTRSKNRQSGSDQRKLQIPSSKFQTTLNSQLRKGAWLQRSFTLSTITFVEAEASSRFGKSSSHAALVRAPGNHHARNGIHRNPRKWRSGCQPDSADGLPACRLQRSAPPTSRQFIRSKRPGRNYC